MENFDSTYQKFLQILGTEQFYPQQTKEECLYLYNTLKQSFNIDGEIAEVGVYEGGSAFFINQFKSINKKLYLFDTFSGFQDVGNFDNTQILWNGKLASDCYERLKYLFRHDNVEIVKGFFPDSASDDFKNKKFSFVHLDADTYNSTLQSIFFFWSRMNRGGVILVHDYINDHAPGVKKALDEFMSDKNEMIITTKTSQAFIIKA